MGLQCCQDDTFTQSRAGTTILQTWTIAFAAAVVTISAYFAGTTLGIFTLDRIGLQILSKASDDDKERKHASTAPSTPQ